MDSRSSLGGSIGRAGVVGAGQMGAGIAGTLVKAGIPTTLVDVSPEMLAAASDRAARIAGHAATEGSHPLLTLAPEPSALREAEFVVEAITEDAEAKEALFQSV